MRRTLLVAGIVLAVVWVAPSRAWACSCLAVGTRTALEDADAAFVGTLLSRDEPQGEVVSSAQRVGYHFAVERWVKGDGPQEVTVVAALDGASCGIEARPGARTGLLLHRDPDGRWRSSLCAQVAPDALLDAARLPVVLGGVAAALLVAVATAARRSVRRSGWTAAHNALR